MSGTNKYSNAALEGKIAIISGGASGIGLGIAKKLSQEGMYTILADLKEPDEAVLNSTFIKTDISKAEDIDLLYQKVTALDLLPDVIICNAGRGIMEKLAEGDPQKWQSVIETNLLGNLRVVRAFVHFLQEKENGDIVVISSVSAERTYPYGGIYSASKAALNMAAETLRLELKPHIRVSTIQPGVVDTDFFRNTIGGGQSVEEIGWGALKAEDVAEAVVFILNRPQGVAVNNITIRPVAQDL